MRAAPRLRLPLATAVAVIAFVCLLSSASAGSTAGDAYEALVKGDSPVAYWRMNETSGATAADASGNGLDATWQNIGQLTLGAPGIPLFAPDTAVKFSNTEYSPDPYGTVGYDSRLNANSFSVEAWVNPSRLPAAHNGGGADSEAILCSRSFAHKWGYMLFLGAYGDHAQFVLHAGIGLKPPAKKNWIEDDTSPAITTGHWYHVVATVDGATIPVTMHLYVNGADVGTVKNAGQFYPNTSGTNTMIGEGTRYDSDTDTNTLAYPFSGKLEEVAIYEDILSPEEVQEHYTAGTGVAPQPTPTLSLSAPSPASSLLTGKKASFSATVGNVSDASDASLTATITGKTTKTIEPIAVNGTTATFSYTRSQASNDKVQLSGTINGYSVSSDSVAVHWLADKNALSRSNGSPGKSRYAKSAKKTYADPVNSSTGNFLQSATDVSLPGAGIPFSLERTYNSRDENVGVLGKGLERQPEPVAQRRRCGQRDPRGGRRPGDRLRA
jgi:hypothetical protein